MKKFLKLLGIASIFAAVLGFGFVACDNGSGGGSSNSETGNGGGTGGGGGGNGGGSGGGGQSGSEKKSIHWTFDDIDMSGVTFTARPSADTSKLDTAWDADNGVCEVTFPDFDYVKDGVALTLYCGESYYNRVNPGQALGSSVTNLYGVENYPGSKGCAEPAANAGMKIRAKGKIKVVACYASNGGSDKTGRHAEIKIGDQTFTDSVNADKAPADGGQLVAEYDSGNTEVDILITGTGIIRFYDIYFENEITTGPIAVKTVTLNETSKSITTGGTFDLTATVSPDDAEDKTVTWSVVEGEGKVTLSATEGNTITVTGAAAGTAKVRATADGKTADCVVTVIDAANSIQLTVTVDGTEVTGSPFTLEKDKDYTVAELCTTIGVDPEEIASADPAPTEGKYNFTENTTIAITLRKLASIAIKTQPTKVAYDEGDNFNPADLVITATYDAGSPKEIAYSDETKNDFSFSPALTEAIAKDATAVTVTYGGQSADITITVTPLPEGLTVAANVTAESVTADGWYQNKANVKANYITENPTGTINVHVENSTNMPTPWYILQNATTANGAVKISATLNITKAGNACGIMELLGADGTSIGQGARISAYDGDNSKLTLISKGTADSTTKVADIALGSDITVETIINFGAGKFQSKINNTALDVHKFDVTAEKTDAFKAIKFNPKSSGTDMTISGVSVEVVAEANIPEDLKPTVFTESDEYVENTEANLNMVATSYELDKSGFVTVSLEAAAGEDPAKIKITSVSGNIGTCKVTVKDDSDPVKSVEINVTVADDGKVTTSYGKYVVPGSTTTETLTVADKFSKDATIAKNAEILSGASFTLSNGNSKSITVMDNYKTDLKYKTATVPSGNGGDYKLEAKKAVSITIYFCSTDGNFGTKKVSKNEKLKVDGTEVGDANASNDVISEYTLNMSSGDSKTLSAASRLAIYAIKAEYTN